MYVGHKILHIYLKSIYICNKTLHKVYKKMYICAISMAQMALQIKVPQFEQLKFH